MSDHAQRIEHGGISEPVMTHGCAQSANIRPRFRFKGSRSRLREMNSAGELHTRRHHRHRDHRHHHTSRSRRSGSSVPSYVQTAPSPGTNSTSGSVDPDTAFRESLFDAMADDEGAQFWEGVYGQPIPRVIPTKEGPRGELESMTDDEYVAYVRAEMYKKTHQHWLEERDRRAKVRREKEQRLRDDANRESKWRTKLDEGRQHAAKGTMSTDLPLAWKRRWQQYERCWDTLEGGDRFEVPWPTWNGSVDGITSDEVERFFQNGPTSGAPDSADKAGLMQTLKVERIRWHPDKFQQKLRGYEADAKQMRGVTNVFQIIDRIWSDLKSKPA